jgi:hypothetical protein
MTASASAFPGEPEAPRAGEDEGVSSCHAGERERPVPGCVGAGPRWCVAGLEHGRAGHGLARAVEDAPGERAHLDRRLDRDHHLVELARHNLEILRRPGAQARARGRRDVHGQPPGSEGGNFEAA